MILDNRNFAIAVLQQAAHRLSDASGSNAALRAHLANMEWRVRIGEDLRMCQRGYGRGYCAVVERSRGVGYRWVPVDSFRQMEAGCRRKVEGRKDVRSLLGRPDGELGVRSMDSGHSTGF